MEGSVGHYRIILRQNLTVRRRYNDKFILFLSSPVALHNTADSCGFSKNTWFLGSLEAYGQFRNITATTSYIVHGFFKGLQKKHSDAVGLEI
jgi:hypothetical protein